MLSVKHGMRRGSTETSCSQCIEGVDEVITEFSQIKQLHCRLGRNINSSFIYISSLSTTLIESETG